MLSLAGAGTRMARCRFGVMALLLVVGLALPPRAAQASAAMDTCPGCAAAIAPTVAVGGALTAVATAIQAAFVAIMQFLESAGSTAEVSAQQLSAQVSAKIANAENQASYENMQREAKMQVAQNFTPDVGRQSCVAASGQQALMAAENNSALQAVPIEAAVEDRLVNRDCGSAHERLRQTARLLGLDIPAAADNDSACAEVAAARGMLADVNERFEKRMLNFQNCKNTDPKNTECTDGALADFDIMPRTILTHDILRLRYQNPSEPDWAKLAALTYCENVILPVTLDPVRGNLANANPVYMMKLRGWQAAKQLAGHVCAQIAARRMPISAEAGGNAASPLNWGKALMQEFGYDIPADAVLSEHKIMELLFRERFSTSWNIAAASAPDSVKLRYISQTFGTYNQLKWRKHELLEQLGLLEASILSSDKNKIPLPQLAPGATPTSLPLPTGVGEILDLDVNADGVNDDVRYVDFDLAEASFAELQGDNIDFDGTGGDVAEGGGGLSGIQVVSNDLMALAQSLVGRPIPGGYADATNCTSGRNGAVVCGPAYTGNLGCAQYVNYLLAASGRSMIPPGGTLSVAGMQNYLQSGGGTRVSPGQAQPGDIVMIRGVVGGRMYSHVGICANVGCTLAYNNNGRGANVGLARNGYFNRFGGATQIYRPRG